MFCVHHTQDSPLALHPTGLPLTAKPLIDAGLLYDDEGQSIKAPNGLTRSVSIGDLISVGDSAGQSVSEEPSAGEGSLCAWLAGFVRGLQGMHAA